MSRPNDPEKRPGRIPLDPDLIDPRLSSGALACLPDGDGGIIAVGRTQLAEEIATAEGVDFQTARSRAYMRYDWRNSHFATCPEADTHRRAR
jgi:hypothetical protein